MAVKRRRVVWTHEAGSALEEAVSYVFEDSPQAARSLLERSLETAASLETFSERGRIVPELRDPAVRVQFQQAEGRRFLFALRDDADGDIRVGFPVGFQQHPAVNVMRMVPQEN